MRIEQKNHLSRLSEFRLALLVGIVGSGAVFVSLISYYLATSRAIVSPVIDEQLKVQAMATLTAFLLGLVSIVYGIQVLFHQEWRRQESGEIREGSKFAVLVRALCSRPYNILFATSALLYGVLFAVVSGTLVYQPTLDLSEGLGVPAALLVTCCDPLGQTPWLVVYMTSHLGLLLVPLNILLLAGTSWMVGANVSLSSFAYKTRAVTGGLKWLGGFVGTPGTFAAGSTRATPPLLERRGGRECPCAPFA